ncbi:hypothetical protein AAG906_027916 [Vitis piasezkii]
MAKTRGAKTPSPSGRHRAPRVVPVQDSMTEPSQPLAIPPSTRRPPTTPGASSSRPKKSASHPPKKKARILDPVEPSEPSSKPQPPTIESQIPSGMTPEVIIRRPMVTQPPIEGNLDCRARPFHSELSFDRETFRLQPELRDSFRLLQRYHMEHMMTPRDFFYPHEPQRTRTSRETAARASRGATVGPMPEVSSSAPPATPGTPPVVPATSEPPPPFESRISISISEFRGLCHTLQTLTATQSILTQQMAAIRAHQDQLIATQTQHTAILRQIQRHLGILSPSEHDIPIPSEPTGPSQDPPLAEQTMPPKEPTTREIEASIPSIQTSTTEPSSPHDSPTTI